MSRVLGRRVPRLTPRITLRVPRMTLANALRLFLDFTQPVAQSFSSPLFDYEWQLQESSGTYADTGNAGASADLTVTGTPLQGQIAVGAWDGSSYISRKSMEGKQAGANYVSVSGIMDATPGNSVAVRVVWRGTSAGASGRSWCGSRRLAGNGWWFGLSSSGYVSLSVYDGTTAKTATVSIATRDSALHFAEAIIDHTAGEIRVRTDLGTATTDISTLSSIASTSGDFTLGYQVGLEMNKETQVCYLAGTEGAYAETIDTESWWTYGNDPTGLLTTHTRASQIGDVVANDASGDWVGWFSGAPTTPQIPIVYRSGLSNTNKLGLLSYPAVTNICKYSNDFTQGTFVTCTATANDGNAPDGFQRADSILATGANAQAISLSNVTVASAQYTMSVWVKAKTGSVLTGRLVFYDESNVAELASQVFTADSTWQRVKVTATTNVGQISSTLRVEIDTDAEAFYVFQQQTVTGNVPGPCVETTSAAAATVACVYKAAGDYVYSVKGEWQATMLRDRVDSSQFVLLTPSTGEVDKHYLYSDSLGRLSHQVKDGAAAVEDTTNSAAGAIVANTEYTVGSRWDSASGVDGTLESQGYIGASNHDGAAFPWEGSPGGGYTADISVAPAMSGVISTVKAWNVPQ